jgi:hypothetical protein
MRTRWVIVAAAGFVALAAWAAVAVTYFFLHPSVALFTAVATAAALCLEGFFWVCAAVLGWSFLAGRRQMLMRLRNRFFPRREH